MQLDKAIQSRRSIRKFKDKSTSWKKIIEAIDSSRYAPMAGDIFTLKFILIDEQEKINKIAKWSEQPFIAQAKYLVVFVTNSKRTKNSYEKKADIFCHQQAGAAMQNFLLKLTEAKLSTCWIGYFNEERIKQILKIPEAETIEAIFPIGHAFETPKKRKQRDLDNFLYFNQWKNNRMKEIVKPEGRYPTGY